MLAKKFVHHFYLWSLKLTFQIKSQTVTLKGVSVCTFNFFTLKTFNSFSSLHIFHLPVNGKVLKVQSPYWHCSSSQEDETRLNRLETSLHNNFFFSTSIINLSFVWRKSWTKAKGDEQLDLLNLVQQSAFKARRCWFHYNAIANDFGEMLFKLR